MTHRASISILFCTISILTAQAQWNKEDSIRLHQLLNGEGELKINTEAVKSIHFDFQPDKEILKGKPMMSQDKPWMKFLEELPKNFGDTTKWIKPKYIRFTPYTPYTKWNEDPINDPIITGEKEWKITMQLNINAPIKYDIKEQRVMPPSKNNNAMQAGVGISHAFDADKLLYENFTKRGRAIRRNRKLAKAWKTYQDYVPTKQDTVKKDTTLMLQLLRQKANRLYPGVTDSISITPDSLLLKHKINSENQTKESR